MPSRAVQILILIGLTLTACTDSVQRRSPGLISGHWHFLLNTGAQGIPFTVEFDQTKSGVTAVVKNATESIFVDEIRLVGDSIHIQMPLYDSDFKGVLTEPGTIRGIWTNYLKGPHYTIPFVARQGTLPRFGAQEPTTDIEGVWEARFSPDSSDEYPAIGQFEQDGNRVTGTFITETGDYRFLEGVVDGDSLKLSCFDGSHAFLFLAEVSGDGMEGTFWSGNHWAEPWQAIRNPNARLAHPDSLTRLKEGYEMVDFNFTDLDGHSVSPKSERYRNKVLCIQVMGTWCPNCIDETRLLNELYGDYNNEGLEVIALAFERGADQQTISRRLARFKESLGVQYSIAYAGNAAKDSATAALPFLDHVLSYPTCIVVDRQGMVRKIRTGFYGPGTGEHYTHYQSAFRKFIRELLSEPA